MHSGPAHAIESGPVKGWLNDLTGDAGEVQGFAQTWANVAAALNGSGAELTRILSDVDTLDGLRHRPRIAVIAKNRIIRCGST